MQTTDLEAALGCLRRLAPEHAERVDLVQCEGTLFVTKTLVDAAEGTGPMERRTIAEDVARGLGLLAELPRDEAESALAELPQGVRGTWMAKLPLTQAQGFGLASAASGGHWFRHRSLATRLRLRCTFRPERQSTKSTQSDVTLRKQPASRQVTVRVRR